jgi:hypothetical protein
MLVVLALVFVALRGYVRYWRGQRPLLSDYFVFAAWLAFVACCACDIRLKALGLFKNDRTYTDPLTSINKDPDKSIEALKVLIWLILLIVAYIRFGNTVLYRFMACQGRFVGILL